MTLESLSGTPSLETDTLVHPSDIAAYAATAVFSNLTPRKVYDQARHPTYASPSPDEVAPCEREPELFFLRGADQHVAANLCKSSCDKVEACGEEALKNKIEWGVWGGLTERERRAILRKQNPSSKKPKA